MDEWIWGDKDEASDISDSDDDGPLWIVSWCLSEIGRESHSLQGEEILDPRVIRLQPQELADELLQGVKVRAPFFYQWCLSARLINKNISRFVRRRAEHERREVD